jgi:hypothetical protein
MQRLLLLINFQMETLRTRPVMIFIYPARRKWRLQLHFTRKAGGVHGDAFPNNITKYHKVAIPL